MVDTCSNAMLVSVMKQIRLTKGFITKVDDADYPELSKYKWHAFERRGFIRPRRGSYKNGKEYMIFMYRQIMNAPTGKFVDHINGDTLDNRRENLRLCDNKQNTWNQKIRSTNKSGYKGVYWRNTRNKWISGLRVNGKWLYLGSFTEAKDAAKAYDNKAKELFGEFARLNFGGTK